MGHWAEIPFQKRNAVGSTQHHRAKEPVYQPCIPFFGRSQVCHCVIRLGGGRDGGGGGGGMTVARSLSVGKKA